MPERKFGSGREAAGNHTLACEVPAVAVFPTTSTALGGVASKLLCADCVLRMERLERKSGREGSKARENVGDLDSPRQKADGPWRHPSDRGDSTPVPRPGAPDPAQLVECGTRAGVRAIDAARSTRRLDAAIHLRSHGRRGGDRNEQGDRGAAPHPEPIGPSTDGLDGNWPARFSARPAGGP